MNADLAAGAGRALPPIRQVALVMLALCLLLPLALLVVRRGTQPVHEPAQTRAALQTLLDAVRPVAAAAPAPDAAALARLLPGCADLPAHEGLPFLQDMAEHLARLDTRLAALTAVEGMRNAPLRRRHQLDTAAWARAVAPDRAGCRQAAGALRLLAGPRGAALLAQVRWKDAAPAQLPAGSLGRTDPWRGWPGCVWIGGTQPGSTAYHVSAAGRAGWGGQLCAQPGLAPRGAGAVAAAGPAPAGTVPAQDDPAWVVPRDLGVLVGALDALRMPQGRLYEDYARRLPEGANRRAIAGNELDVGFSLQLTIDARLQGIAQRVAECYSGTPVACERQGIDFGRVGAARGPGASAMWERAASRMTAVAIVDVASGRIEALGSAHTPCWAQEHDGPARDAGCLPLWTQPRRRPDMLLNHAAFTDDLPGSTIKPILASVFFEEPGIDAQQLSRWLATSATDRFNDLLFCQDRPRGVPCERSQRAQQRAAALGWNAGCDGRTPAACGRGDLLFGRQLGDTLAAGGSAPPLQREVFAGRLFVDPDSGAPMALRGVTREAAASCRNAQGHWHASHCASGAMKPLVNEATGQGQARATALGIATMLARLAAAANGQEAVRRPYLVEQVTDAQGRPVATAATRADEPAGALAGAEPPGVSPAVAQQVLQALVRGTATGGTGEVACRHVFGTRCAEAGERFAGKTGTPSFSLDELTFAQARARCRAGPRQEDCAERPMKYYVAAVRGSGSAARWEKVVAVMSERNWYLPQARLPAAVRDRVHGGGNDVDNIAAEVALRVIDAAWEPAGRGR